MLHCAEIRKTFQTVLYEWFFMGKKNFSELKIKEIYVLLRQFLKLILSGCY